MRAAAAAQRAGRGDEVIRLHREQLAAQLRVYKPNAAPVGAAWGALAHAHLANGELAEAEDAMLKACSIHEEVGVRDEIALAWAGMADLRELQGRMPDAREVRLKGADAGEMVCSYTKVGFGADCFLW